ncbi:hypothetical protein LTR09_011603 [Extremus antarcticus]|uniref:Uncharacterized protein n=1 Tax=Extremus antarcticus TaxID=702011 RepID=A0AAJ0DC22_9PEZI|nr:hypothetical protein LTR09_011603 [Extremus antarcticus]
MKNIAVHNYVYPDDASLLEYYQSVRDLTAGEELRPVKFTETCCSARSGSGSDVFGAQYDPTMKNALIVARYVWQYLTIVQAESFDRWTAVTNLPCSPKIDRAQCATAINETAGYNSGLVYIDGNYNKTRDYNLYMTKRAFMLKHFAYFHRPGSVRYDVPQDQLPSSVNAVASKQGSTWTVLFMNNQTHTNDVKRQLPNGTTKVARLVQPTDSEDWTDVSPVLVVKTGAVNLSLPGQSLSTLQLS